MTKVPKKKAIKTFDSAAQRAALLKFAKALGSRDKALRPDECGDPRINGKRGHIYACPEGFQIFCGGSTALWNRAKHAMSFATATQDGDDEGILTLGRLPTKTEAETIRHYVGVAKRRDISPEERARLAVNAFRSSKKPPPTTALLHG